MLTRFLATATAIAAVSCFTTGALAHAHLMNANPAQGAVLKTSPRSLQMTFSEALVPRFSGVVLTDSSGANITTGPAALTGENTKLTVPLRAPLKPGVYRVAWHAVSADTHRVGGKYSFKVMH